MKSLIYYFDLARNNLSKKKKKKKKKKWLKIYAKIQKKNEKLRKTF